MALHSGPQTGHWQGKLRGSFNNKLNGTLKGVHLSRRERRYVQLLLGIAAAKREFCRNSESQPSIQSVLKSFGLTVGMDRVYLARHVSGRRGSLLPDRIEIKHSWKSLKFIQKNVTTETSNPIRRNYSVWYEHLLQGIPVGGAQLPFEREEKTVFEKLGVKSALLLPIMINEKYWGVLGLEALEQRDEWSLHDESVLRRITMELGSIIAQSDLHMPATETEDISMPKGALERLELESTILAQVSEAIVATDTAGHLCFFNAGAEIIFGLTSDEVLGQHISALTRNKTLQFDSDPNIQSVLEERGAWSGRDALVLKDWRTREVTLTITPLKENNIKVGYIGVYRDVLRDVTVNRQQELRIEHRLRVESALVEASQKLVSDGQIDFEKLLGLMGEAVGAETVYFVEIPSDKLLLQEVPMDDNGVMLPRVWKRKTHATDDDFFIDLGPGVDSTVQRLVCKWNGKKLSRTLSAGEQTALAVPVLSPQGKLHGYLGVEYGGRPPEWQEADSRVLSVLGDLLSTYFERQISEKALRDSEERYRTFVDTTSEAIWRIELEEGVKVDLDQKDQVMRIAAGGSLAECNSVMAELLGTSSHERLVGKPVSRVMPHLEVGVIKEFVRSGYRLLNHEYAVTFGKSTVRHFVINAVGTVDEEKLVRIWGSCVEVTERIRLEQQMVETLEEQQQTIGRDLHDGVGQLLTGVRMLSQNLAEKLREAEGDNSAKADKIADFAGQASERVREIYRGLTPTQLFYEGLATALNELAHNTNALPGITCRYITDGLIDVWERDTKMHLYRIVQEATNNALKHAEASEIIISMDLKDNAVMLQVSDNGKGFDPSIRTGKSLGLNSMAYRARTIKGGFEIKSQEDNGTIVRCTLQENQIRQELTQIVHKEDVTKPPAS
ncbi:MAG: PAS domain S-box protein [Rhodothermales bacterium]